MSNGSALLLSGVVNTYYRPAVGTLLAGASIVLCNPVSASTAIGPGDLVPVLIRQLLYAAINIVNTADYAAGNST